MATHPVLHGSPDFCRASLPLFARGGVLRFALNFGFPSPGVPPIGFLANNTELRAYLCLIATTFCWGCNAVFARLAVGEVSPLLLVCLRWTGVVLLLGLFARKRIARDWREVRPHLLALFLMGACGFTLFNSLMYFSAHTTTALNIGIIQGAIPIFVLLGTMIIHRTAVSGLQWVGVLVTVVGVCIVASHGELGKLATLAINRGDYLMVVACLLYAGYALALRQFRAVSPLSLFATVAGAALIASIPVALVEHLWGALQWPTAQGWLIVILVILLPSFIAQICFIQGVADIGPGRAGVFVNLVPVFAALLAIAVLGEHFRGYHGLALLLVIAGIWLSESKRRRVAA